MNQLRKIWGQLARGSGSLAGHLRRLYDPGAYDYAQPTQWLNVWISAALFVAVGAQILFLVNFFGSLFRKQRATENPWEGATLEWTTPSPAPHLNWAEPPVVYRGPYEYRVNGAEQGYLAQTTADPTPAAAGR